MKRKKAMRKIQDFRQNQLIGLYACVECGRCTNMCPASGTGKTLSPMDLIVKMRDHLTETGASVTSQTPWMPSFVFGNTKANTGAGQSGAEEVAATVEMLGMLSQRKSFGHARQAA